MRPPLALRRECGYKCVHVSDPHDKRWLADDPNFLASLEELDRGLAGGGFVEDDEALVEDGETLLGEDGREAPRPIIEPTRAVRAAPPTAPIAVRAVNPVAPAARAINPARALDPARVLDTAFSQRQAPAPMPKSAAVARPVPSPPVRLVPGGTVGDADAGDTAAPPLSFTRPAPADARSRRPLIDLFPPSALEPAPPLTLGTAVGPQLPPPRPRAVSRAEADADAPSPFNAPTYETFYGLREKPFSLSTDPRFLYQSAAHERAGQEILGAIRNGGGPTVLTAALGMGKTTLCRSLVPQIDRRTVTSLVLEPLQTIDDLVKTMLVDFGVIAREDLEGAAHLSTERLTGTLNSFLESLVPLDARAVVFIDEAHNMPAALLGDVAALLGGPAARVLQLVLVGQPALTTLLKHGGLRALNASVARRTELGPLAADEIESYVTHRLSIAGANTRVGFDEAAIARLFQLSGGSPRLVNLLCDHALTRGQAASAGVISAALIDAAAEDLDLETPGEAGPGLLGSLLIVAIFALLVLAGAAGALWMSRDAVERTIQQWENIPQPPGGPIPRLPVPLAPIPPPADDQ